MRPSVFLPAGVRSGLKRILVSAGYYSRPSFLIIGAQKAGTTALHRYLSLHPQILPAQDKERHFFDQDTLFLGRGANWYHGGFPLPYQLRPQAVTFEATPCYSYYANRAAARIHAYQQDMKLILLLRNPVDRAYSAWNMFRTFHHQDADEFRRRWQRYDPPLREPLWELIRRDPFPKFEPLMRREIDDCDNVEASLEPSFVRRGLYARQIEQYLRYFDARQLLIIENNRLAAETTVVLNEVTDFLGLSRHQWSDSDFQRSAAGRYSEPMHENTRALLREYFAPHNRRLYELLGQDFSWEHE